MQWMFCFLKLDLHTPKTNTLQALLMVWLAFRLVSLILEILEQSFGKLYFSKSWLHFKPHKVADCSVFSPLKSVNYVAIFQPIGLA
jgi:hypothetical protein